MNKDIFFNAALSLFNQETICGICRAISDERANLELPEDWYNAEEHYFLDEVFADDHCTIAHFGAYNSKNLEHRILGSLLCYEILKTGGIK